MVAIIIIVSKVSLRCRSFTLIIVSEFNWLRIICAHYLPWLAYNNDYTKQVTKHSNPFPGIPLILDYFVMAEIKIRTTHGKSFQVAQDLPNEEIPPRHTCIRKWDLCISWQRSRLCCKLQVMWLNVPGKVTRTSAETVKAKWIRHGCLDHLHQGGPMDQHVHSTWRQGEMQIPRHPVLPNQHLHCNKIPGNFRARQSWRSAGLRQPPREHSSPGFTPRGRNHSVCFFF